MKGGVGDEGVNGGESRDIRSNSNTSEEKLFRALFHSFSGKSKALVGIKVPGWIDYSERTPTLPIPITNPNATIQNLEDSSTGNGFLHFLAKYWKLIDESGETNETNETNVESIIDALLKQGADINHQNGNGNTPLHVAVLENKSYIVNFLLEKGADPNIKNNENQTPLDIANTNYNKIKYIWTYNSTAKKKEVNKIIHEIEKYTQPTFNQRTKPEETKLVDPAKLIDNPMRTGIGGTNSTENPMHKIGGTDLTQNSMGGKRNKKRNRTIKRKKINKRTT